MELEPIDPETALELYIAEKETLVADATVDYTPTQENTHST